MRRFVKKDDQININQKGKSRLHSAAKFGDKKLVKSLLESGADVDYKDECGWTALHIASNDSRHVSVVTLLLEHGAAIDSQDTSDWTPLHLAINSYKYFKGPTKVIAELITWDASVLIEDEVYRTSLDRAIGELPVMSVFAEHIIKCKCAKLHSKLKSEFNRDPSNHINKLNFQEVCLQELDIIKSVKYGRNSLYHIFSNYNNPFTFLSNNELGNAVVSPDLTTKFPIYGALLRATFTKAKWRVVLLEKANDIINLPLPNELAVYILSLVDDKGLKNIVKVTDPMRRLCRRYFR